VDVPGLDRPYLDAVARGAGDALAALLLREEAWVHRRVETLDVLSAEFVRRQVSVDFAVPDGLRPALRLAGGQCLVPLAVLRKEILRHFDLRDGADEVVPVLTRDQTMLLAGAALLAKAGDRQGAIVAYDRLAASSSVSREYRDLAILLAVMHQFPEGDPQAAIERLAPLTENGNPWRATALEVTAAAKLKAGDRGAALDIYQKLADDLAAPRALRARAAEMAAALKS
jgi:hypothetical protein